MTSSFLLYSGDAKTADEAMRMFAEERTEDGKVESAFDIVSQYILCLYYV
jgi:hypothetical protein